MKMTPLMAASQKGQCGVIKKLLSRNIEVDQYMHGNTALSLASEMNHPKAVKLLITKGGASVVSSCGSYALYLASGYGHLKIIEILVSNGADVNAIPRDYDGCSSLMYACQNAHLDALKFLLKKGADTEHQSDEGYNALSIACGEHGTNNLEVVNTLLNHGANVNPRQNFPPLYTASGAGHMKIANLLLEKGANVNTCCDHSTPLMYASQEGHMKIVSLLLKNGANVNTRSIDGSTPLMYASQGGHTKICRLLIKYDADMSASHRGTRGTSTAAAIAGTPETLALLKRRSQKCEVCGITAQEKNKKALKRCSGCGLVCYCDQDCQRKHWKNGHKETCKKTNQSNPPTSK
jgi:ankyrin repeat protein